MSDIWKFSESSEPFLRKYLETVNTLHEDNNWSEKFKHKTEACLNYLDDHNTIITLSDDTEKTAAQNSMSNTEVACETEANVVDSEIYLDFCNSIEAEPVAKLNYLIDECLKAPKLIAVLAEHLSVNATEKIINSILAKSDMNLEFVSIFLQTFFPIFLKREQSWLSLDLLLKTNKVFPSTCKTLLVELIKDVSIPSNVLQELLQSSIDLQKEFISTILHINFTEEMFKHHLYTLYMAYKDCGKSENIQNFMQTKLIENSLCCADEKNYGRLLLAFLQAQKVLKLKTDCIMLHRVIEQHKSPFKRPCMTVLNEITDKLNLSILSVK